MAPVLSSCILGDNGFIGTDSEIVTFVAVEYDFTITSSVSASSMQSAHLPAIESSSTTFIAPLLIAACGSDAGVDVVGMDTAPTDQVLLYDNGTAVECETVPSSSSTACYRIHAEWTVYISTTASGVEAAFETAFDAYIASASFAANPDYDVVIYSETTAPSASPSNGDGCTDSFGDFKDCTTDCFSDIGDCSSDLIDEIKAFKESNTTAFYIICGVFVLSFICCIWACCKCCRKGGKDDDDDDSDGEKDDYDSDEESDGTDSDGSE